jgi:hypothetical protein
MWDKIINRLFTVKSIVTLLLTVVFAYLAVIQVVSSDQVMTIFTAVISFYFGTQSERLNSSVKTIE